MKPHPVSFTLTLIPVTDPNVRAGFPERPAEIRLRHALKLLLRGYGLKCVSARPADAVPDPAPVTPEAPPC
jgi:hypothetical protein